MSALTSVADALSLIHQNRPTPKIESVPISEALGQRLAAPIVAKRTHPPAAMSAMDGYAVKLDDVRTENTSLTVIGEAPAGRPFQGMVESGQAVRIFTGSVIPSGADHIIIQENVSRSGDTINSAQAYQTSANIRAAGLDFVAEACLVPEGATLQASHLSMAAASNNAFVQVEKKLRVGLLSNGDELKPPGSELGPGEIINSNPYGLSGLIATWGGAPINLGIAKDSVASIHDMIDASEDIDVFVPIGGASVGDHDHMKAAFTARAFGPVFSKIAVRPGKPTWFSKSGSALVLGLPGNPASALVCAHLFLSSLLGRRWEDSLVSGRLMSPLKENGPREHFMRAQITISSDGVLAVDPAPNQDSSLLRPFLTCNALLRRMPHASPANAGSVVEVVPIGPLL